MNTKLLILIAFLFLPSCALDSTASGMDETASDKTSLYTDTDLPADKVQSTNPDLLQDSACSLCYTCGGSWPVYSGMIPVTSNPVERGSACSGDLQSANDYYPYLCCY